MPRGALARDGGGRSFLSARYRTVPNAFPTMGFASVSGA